MLGRLADVRRLLAVRRRGLALCATGRFGGRRGPRRRCGLGVFLTVYGGTGRERRERRKLGRVVDDERERSGFARLVILSHPSASPATVRWRPCTRPAAARS